jgi:hypothetical protein
MSSVLYPSRVRSSELLGGTGAVQFKGNATK